MLKDTFHEFSEDDCLTLAAALAYYTVFSLPSLLLIVIYMAGSVFGQAAVAGQIQARLSSEVGPKVAGQLQTMVASAAQNAKGGIIATVLGIGGLMFAATGAFSQLQASLNRAWEIRPDSSQMKSFIIKRIVSFLMIAGIGILLLVFLAASAALSALHGLVPLPLPAGLIYAAGNAVSWIVFTLLFGAIFKVLPDARIAWRDVWVGAAVTAALFVIGKSLIGLYLAHSSTAGTYGAAGALALLLLWTYYSSITFFLGAEFTKIWVRRHGREVQPVPGAARIVRAPRAA